MAIRQRCKQSLLYQSRVPTVDQANAKRKDDVQRGWTERSYWLPFLRSDA